MKQTEIQQLKDVRSFLKTQLAEPDVERTMSELAGNLRLKSAFRHQSVDRLWGIIKETVFVYDDDFQVNRTTGAISRRPAPWWSVWRCPPMTASGRTGEAMERREA